MKVRHVLMVVSLIAVSFLSGAHVSSATPPEPQKRPPVIDMHAHAFGEDGDYGAKDHWGKAGSANHEMLFKETYEQFGKCNVVKAVVSGPLTSVETWKSKDEDNRIIRGILIHAPTEGGMNPERFENLVKSGNIEVFGEVEPMMTGGTISDPGWQPYLVICEKYDVPVMLHTGNVPKVLVPWATNLRQRLGDPYLIEDMLVRYPKLRVYTCHFGVEWREHTLALMVGYPQLYTDLGAMLWLNPWDRKLAKEFLADAKLAGVLDRVMFGSDQMFWPHAIEMSVDFLNSLEFLSETDKRGILHDNAARFLRLKQ